MMVKIMGNRCILLFIVVVSLDGMLEIRDQKILDQLVVVQGLHHEEQNAQYHHGEDDYEYGHRYTTTPTSNSALISIDTK